MAKRLETITVERLVYGGSGLGHLKGKVVFVPFTLPEERVEVRIEESKKRYDKGLIVNIIDPSPRRISAPCPYFGRCGGCHWQHIAYSDQLSFKEDIFQETLARIAHVAAAKILPIIPSPLSFGYRNRIRLHVKKGRIGFFGPHSHQIVEIDCCQVAHPLINQVIKQIRDDLSLSSLQKLSQMEIVASPEEGKGIAVLHTVRPLSPAEATPVRLQFDRIADIKTCIIQEPNGFMALEDLTRNEILKFFVREEDSLTYFLYPGVFSQVNMAQNNTLITTIMEWAEISPKHKVLDMFCGMGNFTLPMAKKVKEVTGIETHPLSIKNAIFNQMANGLDNITFLREEVAVGLDVLIRDRKSFDLIVIDPPRKGCGHIIKKLSRLNPSKILYVSCDPATLARDANYLRAEGFDLVRSQPLDMFPQTYHIESLSLFTG